MVFTLTGLLRKEHPMAQELKGATGLKLLNDEINLRCRQIHKESWRHGQRIGWILAQNLEPIDDIPGIQGGTFLRVLIRSKQGFTKRAVEFLIVTSLTGQSQKLLACCILRRASAITCAQAIVQRIAQIRAALDCGRSFPAGFDVTPSICIQNGIRPRGKCDRFTFNKCRNKIPTSSDVG